MKTIHLTKLQKVFFFYLVLIPFFGFGQIITFDEIPVITPPPPVSMQYHNMGVLFPKNAKIVALPLGQSRAMAKSGKNVLVSGDLSREFDTKPLVIRFTQNVQEVTFYTGTPKGKGTTTYSFLLTAYNENGRNVATSQLKLTGQTDITNMMQISSPNNQHTIKEISLTIEGSVAGTFKFIDDLTLKAEGIPPVIAQEPPQVVITNPNTSVTNDGLIKISGYINGDGILPEYAPPKLFVSFPTVPGSTLPPAEKELQLGDNLNWANRLKTMLTFSLEYRLEHFGQNTIKVEAYNGAGVGMDQKTINFLSAEIQIEYNKKGGHATFGDVVQGSSAQNCNYILYQNGAIFQSAEGIHSVLGNIFNKWYSLKSSTSVLGLLGCALGPEKVLTIPTSGKLQDFENGRIYSSAKGTFYVDSPFMDAIDQLNFIEMYGYPVTDPVSQDKQLLPKKWQKFEIEKKYFNLPTMTFPATMEMTDNPPTIWIAHPDFDGIKRVKVAITPRVATNWRSFPCKSLNGPCSDLVLVQSNKRLDYGALEKACKYGHYPTWKAWEKIPQWAALAPGKIIPTEGNIKKSYPSGSDASWNHDCNDWRHHGADWSIDLIPNPEFTHLVPRRKYNLEIEYEYCLVGYPDFSFTWINLTEWKTTAVSHLPGDKIFLAGRWVSDCGCHPWYLFCSDDYKSEIHPPAIMIDMHTEFDGSTPFTYANLIYFDWWYPGEVVQTNIYPPPRPEPNYSLVPAIPKWPKYCNSDGGKCGIDYELLPKSAPNHIRLSIKGRPDVIYNTPPVESSDNGQLFYGYTRNQSKSPHNAALWGDIILKWKKQ